jgi:YegS/Rv2252/BmrU family lipid kinase
VTAATFIVNPASGGGRTARRWPQLAREAARLGFDVDVRLTAAGGEATDLARAALGEGARLVVAVGGDGTASEVVNGFLDGEGRPVSPDAELGIVTSGTGGDLARTFGLPRDPLAALRAIRDGVPRRIDAGLVSFTAPDGEETTRAFLNIASAGMTGMVADRVNAAGRPLGATVAFAWGTVVTFVRYRNQPFTVVADGEAQQLVANSVIVANCRYFASGMKIAPEADPADGVLDVLVCGDLSKADFARNLHRLYRGTHVGRPRLQMLRARMVEVRPASPLPIEVDGETPGTTPAAFRVLAGAILLRVPPVPAPA